MMYYIKRTILTIIEAFLLTALFYVGWAFCNDKLNAWAAVHSLPLVPIPDWRLVFPLCLALLFLFRHLWRRFTLWRILHFSIRRVDKMTGQEFENFLKVRFERMGFSVKTTKASNDYGADLILRRKKLTIAVQAKRYQANIGVKAVQEVIGSMAYYGANKGLVVTNSSFTKNAKALAEVNNIALWDREVLIRILSGQPITKQLNKLLRIY